ncbi:MAG: hypothetical protein HDQ93_04735, partial [Desulfovibrio sp.]|nr:hypothetical protein [Desulfovibrio sp.]
DAFTVSAGPVDPKGVVDGYIQGVQMKFMGERFLGTASQNATISSFD